MKYNPPHHTNPYPHSPRPIIRNFSLFLCSSFLSSDRDKLTRARYDNRATPKSLVKSSSCHENLGWMLRRGREKLFIVKHHHPSSHRVARVSVFGVSVFLYFFFPHCGKVFSPLKLNNVCVSVRTCVYTLPSVYGPFFVLYTSIILHSVSLGESLIVRSKKTGSVWKVLNRNNYKL
jgi:hypothetical protein